MAAWTDSGPSEAAILRAEYPDLMAKWNSYNHQREKLGYLHIIEKKFGIFERICNSDSYIKVVTLVTKQMDRTKMAKDEYLLLEKLLWPADEK
jgi:hypothetical protein